jgi:hypothetical protein
VEPPVEAPPGEPAAAEPPAEPEYRCQRCGAPHDPFQEYCLECGARLTPPAGAPFSVWRRESWTRDSPFWFWAAFLGLLLIALIATGIVLAVTNDDDEQAARPNPTAGPTTSVIVPTAITSAPITTSPLPTTTDFATTAPTTTAATTTAATGTTTGTTTATTTGGTGSVISWPSGKEGYTVILQSIPSTQPRSQAEAKARDAIAKGLDEVGVLDSANYSSLRAGYWVVFSGIHDTEAQANQALPNVRSAGYPVAYVREIVE